MIRGIEILQVWIGMVQHVIHLGIHLGLIPLICLLLHGATCSYMAPTYLKMLYKYAYNKHMDILCDIEWNKGSCFIWCHFCSPMFPPTFPWYQQVVNQLTMNGCKDQRLSTLPCLPPHVSWLKKIHFAVLLVWEWTGLYTTVSMLHLEGRVLSCWCSPRDFQERSWSWT